ncbi:hypothetical protein C8R43DRAFT_977017 [Mycena crocata]|nr:hypothetical protein C8R43DRAFT_977017 [Mycena crocata]
MGCIPSVLVFELEEQELIYPSPNVDNIVKHVNTFFASKNLQCQQTRMLSLGGYHAIIEIVLQANPARSDSLFGPTSDNAFLPRRVVARVDFPFQVGSTDKAIAVPWKLVSEVATMRYVGLNTTIPVPEIYFYDEDLNGNVGGPWMLMEYVDSPSLGNIWHEMTQDQKHSVCLTIADYWNQLLSLRFDAIGSLCFDQNQEITIGPLSMLCSNSDLAYDYPPRAQCGPFTTARDWILAMANQEFDYKTRLYLPPGPDPVAAGKAGAAKAALRVDTNIALLSKLSLLYKDSAIHPIALRPVDFRMHNVMVSAEDPTSITAVIDWEGTQTAPIWDIRRPSFFDLAQYEEQQELDAIVWAKVGNLNAEWAEGMVLGVSLRNATQRARLSDWEPEDYPPEEGST